jgi:hypothetical protein
MKRPQFLQLAAAAAIAPSIPQPPWEKLREQVGDALVKIDFPLAHCKAAPGSARCKTLFENLRNPFFIGDNPALTQTLGWIDAWTTSPSIYAVAARNAQDVAAAVNFAREHNVRLAVKGGGHSYQGTSNAPNSLLIWTRHLNQIDVRSDAVTLGAGVIWLHAYEAVTTQHGRYVQGGGCTTVGVAGLISSGGFGSFSKRYGNAAGNLLEAQVVTADGKIRTVNAKREPDLFWALKGGGGGSFGVITKLTLQLHDLPEFFGGVGGTIKASSDGAYRRLLARFIEFYHARLFNEHWGEQAGFDSDNTLNLSMVFQGLSQTQAQQIWSEFFDWVKASPSDYTFSSPPVVLAGSARHWWDPAFMNSKVPGLFVYDTRAGAQAGDAWWQGDGGQVGWVLNAYESLWLPAKLLQPQHQDELAAALFNATRHAYVGLHFNKGLAGAPQDAIARSQNTAMNPNALHAFALAISASAQDPAYPGIQGHEPDVARGRARRAAVDACMGALRTVAPDGGAYVSESNYFQTDWRRAYWGEHYARLAEVKRKYDPHNLFSVHNGVRA